GKRQRLDALGREGCHVEILVPCEPLPGRESLRRARESLGENARVVAGYADGRLAAAQADRGRPAAITVPAAVMAQDRHCAGVRESDGIPLVHSFGSLASAAGRSRRTAGILARRTWRMRQSTIRGSRKASGRPTPRAAS